MLLLISGSVIATLNDDTNFQLRNTWELETAEYSSTRGYADCKEQLTIGITATTVTGVRTNIATLFKLQEDVAAWKQNQRTPVTMHYTPEGTTTTYRTLITDLKLTLPKDIHIAQTLRGIPNATLDYTRKGLWLSGSEGYIQTTSGFSGNVVTITGLVAQSVYSPTDITISGFGLDDDFGLFLPNGYIFVADRTNSASAAIVTALASGINNGVNTPLDGVNVARTTTTTTNNLLLSSFRTNRSSVITMINAYPIVHVFATVSRGFGDTTGWNAQISALTTIGSLASNKITELNPVLPAISNNDQNETVYIGTISKPPSLSYVDIFVYFTANNDVATNYLYVDRLIFVAETDGTNIIAIDYDYLNNSDVSALAVGGNGKFFGYVRNNYLSSDPTFTIESMTTASGMFTYPNSTGDMYMQTKAATVDMLVSLHNETFTYTPYTGTGLNKFMKLGLRRDKATLIPGV